MSSDQIAINYVQRTLIKSIIYRIIDYARYGHCNLHQLDTCLHLVAKMELS